jgi:hypothetical protein
MKRLCRKLNLELWQAIGLLESIWHVTARETPRGDIGKLSDEDIAIAIDYHGDEQKMITALIDCGWIDVSKQHRLIVHDWPDHADDGVHMRIARRREFFVRQGAPGETILEVPKLSRFFAREREPLREFYEDYKISKEKAILEYENSKRAHAVRTDRQTVRTDRQTVRTKTQSVARPRPRLDLDPALTPPITPNTTAGSNSVFNPESPSSSVRELGIALGLDDDAAGKLLAKSKKIEPAITTLELIELGRMKKSQMRGSVTNWAGLLLTSIPKMLSGAPLLAARKSLNGQLQHAERDIARSRKLAEDTLADPKSTAEERKLAHDLLERI